MEDFYKTHDPGGVELNVNDIAHRSRYLFLKVDYSNHKNQRIKKYLLYAQIENPRPRMGSNLSIAMGETRGFGRLQNPRP